jgi:hypothetical protein
MNIPEQCYFCGLEEGSKCKVVSRNYIYTYHIECGGKFPDLGCICGQASVGIHAITVGACKYIICGEECYDYLCDSLKKMEHPKCETSPQPRNEHPEIECDVCEKRGGTCITIHYSESSGKKVLTTICSECSFAAYVHCYKCVKLCPKKAVPLTRGRQKFIYCSRECIEN